MTLVEHVDPALDAGERLDAFALEPDEDAGGVLVGAAPDLARLGLGVLDDLAGPLLRRADELALLEHLRRLLLGAADDRVPLLASALRDAAGLLGDAARLAHLVGHGDAQLVDELEDGGLVEHDVVRQRHLLAGRDERLQTFHQKDDVRGPSPPSARLYAGVVGDPPGERLGHRCGNHRPDVAPEAGDLLRER